MAEADDPTNNIQWVILAICGGLIVLAALILLCVFCCCGICGRGGNMCPCMPGGQQVIMIAPAQNNGQPVVANAAPPNPVPDPTFVSEMKSGGSFQFSHNGGQTQMAGDKMRVVKLTGTDPTTAVRQVAKEYYNNPNGPPDASPAERVKPPPPPEPVPTYVIEDSGYRRGREAPPYQIMRARDPAFDNAKWVPPWQRRK